MIMIYTNLPGYCVAVLFKHYSALCACIPGWPECGAAHVLIYTIVIDRIDYVVYTIYAIVYIIVLVVGSSCTLQ